jgi:uncharacterized protein (DUF2252 family)
MASDLARTPTSGLTVQLCGDAHMANFGMFATPERRLVFDANDFDETLPGPWEWDVKRLAASFEVAGRELGLPGSKRAALVRMLGHSYREQMRKAAAAPVLASWYERLDADGVAALIREAGPGGRMGRAQEQRTREAILQAQTRDSLRAFRKLVVSDGGRLRFKAQPPLLVPMSDIGRLDARAGNDAETVRDLLTSYTSTLLHEHHPIREFEFVDMARKVVGVGSVGTRCWVILLRGRDDGDPLILQAKEAQASVLERYLGPSTAAQHGERVVRGQRLMQSGSDIFLGWQRVIGMDGLQRDFYIRQLYDWKQSMDVMEMRPEGVLLYARACGETLARAHARTGDRVAIAAYLGGSDRFEQALEASARRYADQNDEDYAAFKAAIASGRLETTELM